MVKGLFIYLQREDAVLPKWFCFHGWWKASSLWVPQHSRDSPPLILALLQLDIFRCVLILQEICDGENRKKKKSNSVPYDFYFYNLSMESGGRHTMGQRYQCIWYKSSKPHLVIFNAGVALFTLEASDAYQLKWKVGTRICSVDHADGFMPEINLAQ